MKKYISFFVAILTFCGLIGCSSDNKMADDRLSDGEIAVKTGITVCTDNGSPVAPGAGYAYKLYLFRDGECTHVNVAGSYDALNPFMLQTKESYSLLALLVSDESNVELSNEPAVGVSSPSDVISVKDMAQPVPEILLGKSEATEIVDANSLSVEVARVVSNLIVNVSVVPSTIEVNKIDVTVSGLYDQVSLDGIYSCKDGFRSKTISLVKGENNVFSNNGGEILLPDDAADNALELSYKVVYGDGTEKTYTTQSEGKKLIANKNITVNTKIVQNQDATAEIVYGEWKVETIGDNIYMKKRLRFLNGDVDKCVSNADGAEPVNYEIKVGLVGFVNENGETVELETDGTKVESYNSANPDAEPLVLMPDNAYSFPDKVLTLAAGANSVTGLITVDPAKLENWKSYVIPLKVKSSSIDFDNRNSIMLICRIDNLQGWYMVEEMEGNQRDWSINHKDFGLLNYPFARYIKKTGAYTYETGYFARSYTFEETTTITPNGRNIITRNPKTNAVDVHEGGYYSYSLSSYDSKAGELTIHYNYVGSAGATGGSDPVREKMVNRKATRDETMNTYSK